MGSRLRLRFYGRLRDAAGAAARDVERPDSVRSTAALVAWLAAGDEALGAALSHPSVRIAVGDTIIERDDDIRQATEISFLPPFSGG